MIWIGTGRRLLGRRGPDGEAVRMPDVVQVESRVEHSLEGHHGEQEHEGDGERAPALGHGDEQGQRGHEEGGRHGCVSTQGFPRLGGLRGLMRGVEPVEGERVIRRPVSGMRPCGRGEAQHGQPHSQQ